MLLVEDIQHVLCNVVHGISVGEAGTIEEDRRYWGLDRWLRSCRGRQYWENGVVG